MSGAHRPFGTGMLRQLAQDAATHPRMQRAVSQDVAAELPAIIEDLLRTAYAGEVLNVYVASGRSVPERAARDRRIRAAAAAGEPLAAVAAREGVSLRRAQQILASSPQEA